jgi:hypothetical protein
MCLLDSEIISASRSPPHITIFVYQPLQEHVFKHPEPQCNISLFSTVREGNGKEKHVMHLAAE